MRPPIEGSIINHLISIIVETFCRYNTVLYAIMTCFPGIGHREVCTLW